MVDPCWPELVWFSDLLALLDAPPWEIPVRRDLLTWAGARLYYTPAGDVEIMGLAPERDQVLNAGLSTEVVETILNSRAPSTRKLYSL